MSAEFPALGFDPLPGDPDASLRLSGALRLFSERMSEEAGRLRRLPMSWEGRAADAFLDGLTHQPRDLDRCAEACERVADHLDTYHRAFQGRRQEARFLEAACLVAQGESFEAAEAVRRKARCLQEDLESEIAPYAFAVEALAEAAPNPPVWDHLLDWAEEVIRVTPFGAAAMAAMSVVGRYPEFFSDLADLGSSISQGLGLLAIPLLMTPVLGQALAAGALITSVGVAVIKTTLHADGAKDADGVPYVRLGELGGSWLDVGLNAAGLAAAGVARSATSGVSLGEAVAAEATVPLRAALADARDLALLHRALGTKDFAVWFARFSAREWGQLPFLAKGLVGAGVAIDIFGPTAIGGPANVAGIQEVVRLPAEIAELVRNAPSGPPDLRLPSGSAGPLPGPGIGPVRPAPEPVMGPERREPGR